MTRRPRPLRPLVLALAALAVLPVSSAHAAEPSGGTLTRASFAATGLPITQGVGLLPDVSADGRYVVFTSTERLVRPDYNRRSDVFVRDRVAQTTVRVSTAVVGEAATGSSTSPGISGDGRSVVFVSDANNLVAGDRDDLEGVFVRDLRTGTTVAVDVTPGGRPGAGGPAGVDAPSLSADGRFVVFTSSAGDLARPVRSDTAAVYVRDLVAGTTRRVGVPAGAPPGTWLHSDLSSDGRFVTFETAAALEPGDTDGLIDAYLHDLQTGRTERISTPSGTYANVHVARDATVSNDGRWVAFRSYRAPAPGQESSFVADVWLRDRNTGTTRLVSRTLDGRPGNGDSSQPVISDDGRVVVYQSDVPRIVADDGNGEDDVFRYDVAADVSSRISVPGRRGASTGGSGVGGVSADGAVVAFSSRSPLVGADRNDVDDVYVWERLTPG